MTVLEININPSFVTWELCNWSSDRDLPMVTWYLPDTSCCFETFFWKFSTYLKISSFSHFFMFFFPAHMFYFFLFFSPQNHLKASCCFLLHPLPAPSYFTSPSNFPNVHLWTVDQNSWRKYDFLFQEVRQKWQGIDLIKICVISNYRFIWVQKKEERLALEVRIISWGRLYFCFINNKQRDFPDCPVVKVVKTQRFQCRRHGIDPWSGN